MLLTLFKIIGFGIAVSVLGCIDVGNIRYNHFFLVNCNLDLFPVFDSSYPMLIWGDLILTSINIFVIKILGVLILLFIIKELVALFNFLYPFWLNMPGGPDENIILKLIIFTILFFLVCFFICYKMCRLLFYFILSWDWEFYFFVFNVVFIITGLLYGMFCSWYKNL